MTPEQRAHEIVIAHLHDITGAPGRLDMAATIATAIRAAQRKALEWAAQIAERAWNPADSGLIATCIRALIPSDIKGERDE